MKMKLIAAAVAALMCGTAVADDGWRWDLRVRNERVDDALAGEVHGTTARLRLGWLWNGGGRWTAYGEGEHVEAIGDPAFPLIPDAQGTELNQAWLRWTGEDVTLTAGRQRLTFGNQRLVGNSGWRQNEQTFDAFLARVAAVQYAYIDRTHRVTGVARDHRTHFVEVAPGSGITVYGLLLDDLDVPTDSSATIGVRWTDERDDWRWAVEGARQRDYGGQPLSYSADYFLIEPSWTPGRVTWTIGWERLGGDGTKGFITPLASLHGFNGWADRFVVTPAVGLDDRYLGAAGPVGRGRLTVKYHEFSAVRGSADLGHEWNASYARPFGARRASSWLVKYADFRGEGFAPDVQKLWFQLEWRTR